ncbi:DUF5683 domain-containing protein [Fulvivirga maritima]|uniref:DUF5683 domain-containing protein n=1 Tax=Fulvivirga maritima TaxID=2904247 RepID=UPI001F1D646B|nr:DUF5683 domain-containing protein [Fulvivirga maritima]UII26451.1 DUF5683 domain-containing protein [Fulvivirga maritima]
MKNFFLSTVLIAFFGVTCQAQITPPSASQDTTRSDEQQEILIGNNNAHIEEIDTYADRFVPRKASLYAAVLPGAGQIYNKKYWKLPFVYGGFIALGYAVHYYDGLYQDQREELFRVLNDSNYNSIYGSETTIRSNIDNARRERDFYLIMTGVLYLLQIADAHIDAHLKEFDLNPQLKVSLEPSFENSQYFGYNAGLSLKLKF